MTGLADKGFLAKSFRPTGATIAVNSGVLPETVVQIGRWKTKEVFLNHYVYPNAPQSYTKICLSEMTLTCQSEIDTKWILMCK